MYLIFLTPLVQPFRNKRRQVTLVFNRALNQHSARGSFTHSDNTSVWKVPQRDQCDPRPAAAAPSGHAAGPAGWERVRVQA